MRTIKFRGKRIGNGEWVYGDLLQGLENDSYIVILNENGVTKYEVDEETIGQFTGLYDKYGREIYEWDILQMRANFTGVVRWNNKGNFYINDDKEQKEKSCENLGIMLNYAKFEIIGNYFDNPELVKGGQL